VAVAIKMTECPICKKPFRRKIEEWMKFKCKYCGKDICNETDVHLYSGECAKCFWKEFNKNIPKQKEKKENIIEIEKIEEKKKIVQPNLDKWF